MQFIRLWLGIQLTIDRARHIAASGRPPPHIAQLRARSSQI
jgi:hypothetical protein